MVVRGSCSCYGHAQHCIPTEQEMPYATKLRDMVFGRCECTHNTKGENCNDCQVAISSLNEDFENNLELVTDNEEQILKKSFFFAEI